MPYVICYEIIRQFDGKKPMFGIVALSAMNHGQLLYACGLVDSLIVSYAVDVYPRPNVSAVFWASVGSVS